MLKKKLMLRACVAVAGGAFIFQFGIGACINATQLFNPCGTLLNLCTQQQLDFLNLSIPDYEFDPSCTIPGACGGDLPFADFSGGLTGTGPGVRAGGSPPP